MNLPTKYNIKPHPAYFLYLLYIISYFLRLPARIPILGAIRLDALLAASIFGLLFLKGWERESTVSSDRISRTLKILILYIILSLPFVEWPGSVVKYNFLLFFKAVLFFYFTTFLIRTEKELKNFLLVYISCQSLRVIEPLWLHITTGYWGSATFIGTGFSDRLAGAPYDTVNPNGLAFIIVITIPLLYFMTKDERSLIKSVFYILLPIFLYTMLLTQSRSGIICLGIIFAGIIINSGKKLVWIIGIVITLTLVAVNLDPVYLDRYASINIFDESTASHGTAQGRIEGWISGLKVFIERPVFGHGLGTSSEAGWNVVRDDLVAHNMYIEILQELGIIGLIIFMVFLKNILFTLGQLKIAIKKQAKIGFLYNMTNAMQVIVIMLFVFSFASYGLSVPIWYFVGGISVVLLRLINDGPEINSL